MNLRMLLVNLLPILAVGVVVVIIMLSVRRRAQQPPEDLGDF